MKQLEENVKTFDEDKPLDQKERALLFDAAAKMTAATATIASTIVKMLFFMDDLPPSKLHPILPSGHNDLAPR